MGVCSSTLRIDTKCAPADVKVEINSLIGSGSSTLELPPQLPHATIDDFDLLKVLGKNGPGKRMHLVRAKPHLVGAPFDGAARLAVLMCRHPRLGAAASGAMWRVPDDAWRQIFEHCAQPPQLLAMNVLKLGELAERYGRIPMGMHGCAASAAMEVVRRRNQAIETERGCVLRALEHPFVPRLRYAFASASRLCLLHEYLPGGELFYRLKVERRFSLDRTRLYAAEIALALGHLHRRAARRASRMRAARHRPDLHAHTPPRPSQPWNRPPRSEARGSAARRRGPRMPRGPRPL